MKTRSELEQENTQIQAQLAHVRQQLLDNESALQSKDAFIDQLKEALILARHRQFAKTTESLRSLQSELFDEAELGESEADTVSADTVSADSEIDSIDVPAHRRKKGGRKPLPADLPRLDVIHDLNEADKVCAQGHDLMPMSDKVSEQLDIIPMQIQVIRHIRKQYHCPCCEGAIKTANKPTQPIPKSQASAGLLSYIAVSKYADSLPLYRQSQILKRFDIDLNRTTLANWMIQCGQLVQPLINRLEEQLLESPYLHMDETPVQVLHETGKAAQSKSYMWVRCAGPPGQRVIVFDYDPSRSAQVPNRLLADYKGALMVDGYEVYSGVCRSGDIQRLGCWVHARRKFVEVNKASKKNNPQASYVIKLIARLYAIEKALQGAPPTDVYATRHTRSKPIINKLRAWLDETQPKVAPKMALGKALHYLNSQWPRLTGYLEDGRYPIDNNPVENAIRPFTVGRKNWLFSASVQGVKASANLYSLIETAKAHGLEPYRYLKQVFTELPKVSDYNDVDRLLPDRIELLSQIPVKMD